MKIIFWIVLLAILIIWTAKPDLNIKPFKLTFANGYYAIGLLLVVVGLSFIKYQGTKDGRTEGIESVLNWAQKEALAEKDAKPKD